MSIHLRSAHQGARHAPCKTYFVAVGRQRMTNCLQGLPSALIATFTLGVHRGVYWGVYWGVYRGIHAGLPVAPPLLFEPVDHVSHDHDTSRNDGAGGRRCGGGDQQGDAIVMATAMNGRNLYRL